MFSVLWVWSDGVILDSHEDEHLDLATPEAVAAYITAEMEKVGKLTDYPSTVYPSSIFVKKI